MTSLSGVLRHPPANAATAKRSSKTLPTPASGGSAGAPGTGDAAHDSPGLAGGLESSTRLVTRGYADEIRGEVRTVRMNLDRLADRLAWLEKKLVIWNSHDIGKLGRGSSPDTGFAPSAYSLVAHFQPDGAAKFQINGAAPFRLPPLLAAFLVHIAADEGETQDPLVPWKSRGALIGYLEQVTRVKNRRRYLNNLVCQLKNRLRAAVQDPDLVQVNKQFGIRFAVKRGGAKVIGGAPW